MKTPVLETRREVMVEAASAFPGGQPCAAACLGINPKRLKNQIYDGVGCVPLSDEQIHVLESQVGTTHLPDYICAMYGGIFVRLPDVEDLDNVDLHHRSLNTMAKRGMVDQMIVEALKSGEIDDSEAQEILALHAKHMAARHEEVKAVIELHRAK